MFSDRNKTMKKIMMLMTVAVAGMAVADCDVDALKAALAKVGDAETQFRIGNCYAQDKGLKRSLGEAVAWYRKAAALGCAAAKDMLRELEK